MDQTVTIKQRKLVTAVTLAPEYQEIVVELARKRDWSIAQTGGYLIKVGLETLGLIPEQEPDSPLFNAEVA
jgi:hypothetical protein